MSVRLTHEGLPSDITPYQLKQLLRRARIALGLSKGSIEYLAFAIENCQPSDFQNGRICAIWYSLERLSSLFRLLNCPKGLARVSMLSVGKCVCSDAQSLLFSLGIYCYGNRDGVGVLAGLGDHRNT